ncbi:MAG: hypothetical protein PHU85_05550 [Phycisphaerae bacterium]|nr:hypothetical protein [Phycisphaerae bacterium]
MTNCLSDIQIEDALCGDADEAARAHLADCPACRDRLAAAQAVRGQLRATLGAAKAPSALVDRIRRMTVAAQPVDARPPVRFAARMLRHWRGLAAAAGLLVVLSVLAIMAFTRPTEAVAAQELIKLHEQNLAGQTDLLHHGTHDQSETYLSDTLGFKVAIPHDQGELRLRGCCVTRFLGQPAGNMMIAGPNGPVSVIVSNVNARELTTKVKIERDGRTYWVCPMKGFTTVAVQDGRLIYAAVGNETPDRLVAVLGDILSQHTP